MLGPAKEGGGELLGNEFEAEAHAAFYIPAPAAGPAAELVAAAISSMRC